jgi:hypothetical protein
MDGGLHIKRSKNFGSGPDDYYVATLPTDAMVVGFERCDCSFTIGGPVGCS